nr:accessory Sec system glycosylation chaperone GtfB [Limosilactobacillus kribbianus]
MTQATTNQNQSQQQTTGQAISDSAYQVKNYKATTVNGQNDGEKGYVNLNLTLNLNPQQIKSGDYLDVKYGAPTADGRYANYSISAADSIPITVNGTQVGTVEKEGSQNYTYYRLQFNDAIKNFKAPQLNLNLRWYSLNKDALTLIGYSHQKNITTYKPQNDLVIGDHTYTSGIVIPVKYVPEEEQVQAHNSTESKSMTVGIQHLWMQNGDKETLVPAQLVDNITVNFSDQLSNDVSITVETPVSDMLTTTWQIAWVDRYNQHGQRFAKVVYANGHPSVQQFYSRKGAVVLTENLITGDLFLDYQGTHRHFPTMAALVVYYLELRHYQLERVFYNTLNISLQVAMGLPAGGEDTLFWDEPTGDELPGNMQYLVENATRTKHVVFQNYRDWQRLHAQLPQDGHVDFRYLGVTYPHPRGNALRPQALIMTNSDQIEQLPQLIQMLPKVTFHIVALTNMSDQLLAMNRYDNVKLYPRASDRQIQQLVKGCDIYLDINHGAEILDAVMGAFEQNMLILGFADTLHRPKLVLPANVYQEKDVQQLARKVLAALVNPKLMKQLIDDQRKEASEVLPKEFHDGLGAIYNG